MEDFIFYSGIFAFFFLTLTTLLKALKKKPRWHQKLAYTTYSIAAVHATLALYRAIRLYFLYS